MLKLSLQLSQSKKKLETKYTLIDGKKYKSFAIYFIGYVHGNLIKILSLHCHKLMEKKKKKKDKQHEGKKLLDDS